VPTPGGEFAQGLLGLGYVIFGMKRTYDKWRYGDSEGRPKGRC
jgi:hypothetical protein